MVMGVILKLLEVFHNRVSRRIVGMTARSMTGREWYFPPRGRSAGDLWATANQGIYSAEAGHRGGEGGLL